ncbi:hypothetical protein [Crenalkalicoccus roseus]|uniref:hypothetical protein n=1 Tax=Crenalkalicoccus roseus TaxID=1485588 RepID=UPI001081CCA5|nr:hypothetical protein [Crenalkalicoccus roseus]
MATDHRPTDAMPRGERDRPPQEDTRASQRGQRRTGPEPGEDPAAGSVESPVAPGEAQAGDLNEAASQLGGPVDVFPVPGRARREGRRD